MLYYQGLKQIWFNYLQFCLTGKIKLTKENYVFNFVLSLNAITRFRYD